MVGREFEVGWTRRWRACRRGSSVAVSKDINGNGQEGTTSLESSSYPIVLNKGSSSLLLAGVGVAGKIW